MESVFTIFGDQIVQPVIFSIYRVGTELITIIKLILVASKVNYTVLIITY